MSTTDKTRNDHKLVRYNYKCKLFK